MLLLVFVFVVTVAVVVDVDTEAREDFAVWLVVLVFWVAFVLLLCVVVFEAAEEIDMDIIEDFGASQS